MAMPKKKKKVNGKMRTLYKGARGGWYYISKGNKYYVND